MCPSRLFAVLSALLLASATASAAEPPKIGDRVGKLKFTDIRALPRTLDDFGAKKAYVLAFTNTTCPLAQRYLPILQAMEKDYAAKNVQFVAVNAAPDDTLIAMATQAVKYEVPFPCVKDFDGSCASDWASSERRKLLCSMPINGFAIAGGSTISIGSSGNRKEPTSRDLQVALDAVLAGKTVANAETEVDGCPITFPKAREAEQGRQLRGARRPTSGEALLGMPSRRGIGPVFAYELQTGRGASRFTSRGGERSAHAPRGSPATTSGRSSIAADYRMRNGPRSRTGLAPAPRRRSREGTRAAGAAKDKWQIGKPDLVARFQGVRSPGDGRHSVPVRDPAAPLRRGYLGPGRADPARQPARRCTTATWPS